MLQVLLLWVFWGGPAEGRASSYDGPLFDAHSHSKPAGGEAGSEGVGLLKSQPELLAQIGGGLGKRRGGPGKRRGGPRNATGEGDPTYSTNELVAELKKAGVVGMYLFAPPVVAVPAQQAYPDFIYPFMSIRLDPTRHRLGLSPEEEKNFLNRFQQPVVRGIGELSLRHRAGSKIAGNEYPVDGSAALKLYDMAMQKKAPVTVHAEHGFHDEIERVLSQKPDLVFIWAHVGDGPATLVQSMMRKYPNLYADISCQNPYFQRGRPLDEQSLADSQGRIKREWQEVFEEFPDRFLFGLDVTSRHRFNLIPRTVAYYRGVLGQLEPATAAKIGYLNAKRLLGI